jgi:hypothetical protein
VCDWERINVHVFPPPRFVAGVMSLAVVHAAEWHGELIAHLSPQRAGLREFQVMWV